MTFLRSVDFVRSICIRQTHWNAVFINNVDIPTFDELIGRIKLFFNSSFLVVICGGYFEIIGNFYIFLPILPNILLFKLGSFADVQPVSTYFLNWL